MYRARYFARDSVQHTITQQTDTHIHTRTHTHVHALIMLKAIMRLIIKPETETRTHQQHRKLAVWRCVEQRVLLETFIIGENAPLQYRSSRACVCVCVRVCVCWIKGLFWAELLHSSRNSDARLHKELANRISPRNRYVPEPANH